MLSTTNVKRFTTKNLRYFIKINVLLNNKELSYKSVKKFATNNARYAININVLLSSTSVKTFQLIMRVNSLK